MAQERLRHVSLPPAILATREQIKALLQSALADKLSQKLRLLTLMPPATEQQTKRKCESQAAKNSIGNQKIRVLNMNQKLVLRRYKKMKQRKCRKALLQSKPRRPSSKAVATIGVSQPSGTINCNDRQPLQAKQGASCSSSLTSQWANNDYLARCQQQARHTYTLPPGVSSEGLSEEQIARGNFYLRPNDRYTKRQQDLLDMDDDDGSEDGWTYCKDENMDDDNDTSSPATEQAFKPLCY